MHFLQGQANNVAGWFIAILLLAVVLMAIPFYIWFTTKLMNPWYKAICSGTPVKLMDLIAMKCRQTDVNLVLDCLTMAKHADTPVTLEKLESAYQSGADVNMVTRAFIQAKKSGQDLSFEELVDAQRSEQLRDLLNTD